VQYGEDAYFCPFDVKIRKVTDSAGQQVQRRNGQLVLEPDPDSMTSMVRLLEALNTTGASNRVLFADCCRDNPNAARGLNGRAFGSNVKITDLRPGTAAIFSCSEGERSFEHEKWLHGAFTKAFLDHCQNLDSQSDSTVTSMVTPLFRQVDILVRGIQPGATQRVNPVINGIVDLKLRLKPKRPEQITNSLGMQLRLIKAGEFQMGTNETKELLVAAGFKLPDDQFDITAERPQHKVTLKNDFYMGVHEVTRGQYAEFVKATGYKTDAEKDGQGGEGFAPDTTNQKLDPQFNWRNPGFPQTDHHPVVNVSWNDAMAFCDWLSEVEGQPYRLPTETEWEYACRAGTTTRFSTGDDPYSLQGFANVYDKSFEGSPELAFKFDDGQKFTAPVGSYRPNSWGLHDMHGNVREVCADVGQTYGSQDVADSGDNFQLGNMINVRGSSYHNSPVRVRSTIRHQCYLTCKHCDVGFRVIVGSHLELAMIRIRRALETKDEDRLYRLLDELSTSTEDLGDQTRIADTLLAARASLAHQKIEDGRVKDGLADLRDMETSATEDRKRQIVVFKAQVLFSGNHFEELEHEMSDMINDEDANPDVLNQMAWSIYESVTTKEEDVPKLLIESAVATAEKALDLAPENGMILDTLAHLQHLQGRLNEALATQKKAVATPGTASEESLKDMKSFLEQLQTEKKKAK